MVDSSVEYLDGESMQVSEDLPTVFTRDLKFGMTGNDVKFLQQYLNNNGFEVSPHGYPGSPGNETQMFGNATLNALIRFQTANNIYPNVGYFGPITRGFIQ